jgi:hypothetical protein
MRCVEVAHVAFQGRTIAERVEDHKISQENFVALWFM